MPGYFISFDDEGQPSEGVQLTTKERVAQLEIFLVRLSLTLNHLFNISDRLWSWYST
jgi:hypothetical protein